MKKMKCVYNKQSLSSLKDDDECICYCCYAIHDVRDLREQKSEELKCPICGDKSILAVGKVNMITEYWIDQIAQKIYPSEK